MRLKAKRTLQPSSHVRTRSIYLSIFPFSCFCLLTCLVQFCSLYISQRMSHFSHYALAVLDVWVIPKTTNRTFLESSGNASLSAKEYPSSREGTFWVPKSCLPLEFLSDLHKQLHQVITELASPSTFSTVSSVPAPRCQFVQDAILFMGERDEDGNDSGNPGLLQALQYEWNGIPDREPQHLDREQKPGLAGDLENLSRFVEQRIKICRSRILTLTGKEKRAQLMMDDPK